MKVWIKCNGYFVKVGVPLDADIYDLKRAAKLELINTSKDFDITKVQLYLPGANVTDPLHEAALVLPYNENGVGNTYETPFILKTENSVLKNANLITSNTGKVILF